MKGVSIVLQDGKIAEIGAKIVPPKGVRIIEGKGLRVYPGHDRFRHGAGTSEVSAVRETVDTGEIGEFMPQLRALSRGQSGERTFRRGARQRHHQRHDLPVLGRRRRWRRTFRRRRAPDHLRPGGADPHRWLDLGRDGDRPLGRHAPASSPPSAARRRTRRRRSGRGPRNDSRRAPEPRASPQPSGPTSSRSPRSTSSSSRPASIRRSAPPSAPGFKRDLKLEAMLPVLEGKVPLAVSARRASVDPRCHRVCREAEDQDRDPAAARIAKAGPELKAKNIPVILGRVLALPEQEDDPYDGVLHPARRGLQSRREVRFRHLQQRVCPQSALPGRDRGRVRPAIRGSAEGRHHQPRPDLGTRGRPIGSVEKGKVGRPDGHHRRPAGDSRPR